MKKGVIIVVASKLRQVLVYEECLREVTDLQRVLILAVDQMSELDTGARELFDVIDPVTTNGAEGIFVYQDPTVLRQHIKAHITQYDPAMCHVFSPDEGNIDIVAEAARGLGVHSFDPDKAVYFRDKDQMKRYLQPYAVELPHHVKLSTDFSFEELERDLGLPFIVKPIDGAASVGVEKIGSHKDYENWLASDIDLTRFEAEEFIIGDLFHVDTTTHNGTIVASLVSEYIAPVSDCFTGISIGSIALMESDPRSALLLRANKEVLDAFGVDGNFHSEFFITPAGRVVFLEIAWRQAGIPCNENFTQKTGFTQSALQMGLQIGLWTTDQIVLGESTYMDVIVPTKYGYYQGLSMPISKANYEITSEKNLGEKCEKPNGYFDQVAFLRIFAKNHHELRGLFDQIREAGPLGVFT